MRRWRSAAAVIVAVVLLTGCTTGASDSSGDEAARSNGLPTEDFTEGFDGDVSSGASPESAGRDVIVQGYLTITSEDPIEATDDAVRIVERAGGRVDSRSEQPGVGGGNGASAQLVVRIPSDELTDTLDEIKELGEVEDVSINSTDVTAQTQDLDARIEALQASVDRLLALLASATSTTDLIAIETALSERQANLESLQAQRRYLSEQVDLSTITLDFGSVDAAPIDEPEGFLDGLVAGWNALVGFLGATLIAFGVSLPWLAAVAVLALVGLLIVRAGRRSRRAKNARSKQNSEESANAQKAASAE
ncbi:MAG: DUF4349 domain-containing protein [Microbacteriaceae bacterium]|nr:DUF4349 domain-containing protein [Microbacteriaceae bacterium]